MHILTRSSSFIPFLPRNLLEAIPDLPKDSFFYVEKSKASVNIEPPLAQGSAFLEGDGLKLEISSSGKEELQIWFNMSDITTTKGKCVGKVFTLVGEDYIDEDFNDIYVSISAWDKAN